MKKILLLFIILFCTGCSAEYTLNIDRQMNFDERLEITGSVTDYGFEIDNYTSKEDLEEYYSFIIKRNQSMLNELSEYSFEENTAKDKNYSIVIVSEKRDVKKLSSSVLLKKLYNNSKVEKNTNGYSFSLKRKEYDDDAYTPLEFDKITVKIKSNKKIINANADKVRNGVYIWELVNSNAKDIYFEITETNKILNWEWVILAIIVVGTISFIIFKKIEKINEIK